jgi:hypothetical protein
LGKENENGGKEGNIQNIDDNKKFWEELNAYFS